jgi:hypothetical protein
MFLVWLFWFVLGDDESGSSSRTFDLLDECFDLIRHGVMAFRADRNAINHPTGV